MSYANLVNQSCANEVEFFCRLRDFICKRNGTYDYSSTGIGWTLHDSSYGTDEDNPAIGDWVVFKSVGENGNEDIYIRLTWQNTSAFSFCGFLYWDNSSHAGVSQYLTTTSNLTISSTAGTYTLYVYGDLDKIAVINYDGSAAYVCNFGKLAVRETDVVTGPASLSSGSDISITVSAVPSSWEVGRKIFIRDNAHVEIITIKTLVGLVITADLTYSYTNPKLSSYVGYYAQSGATPVGDLYLLIGHAGNTINQRIIAAFNSTLIGSSYGDPEPLNDEYIMGFMPYIYTPGYAGYNAIIQRVHTTGLNLFDKLILGDGTEYRYFYSSGGLAIKEV